MIHKEHRHFANISNNSDYSNINGHFHADTHTHGSGNIDCDDSQNTMAVKQGGSRCSIQLSSSLSSSCDVDRLPARSRRSTSISGNEGRGVRGRHPLRPCGEPWSLLSFARYFSDFRGEGGAPASAGAAMVGGAAVFGDTSHFVVYLFDEQ